MTEIVSLVKPTRAEIVYAEGNFSNAKNALEAEGYRIASVEEIAKARIEQGKDADVSKYGGWVKEGFVLVPQDKKFRLTLNSPIMANAEDATNCHRNGKEFYLTKEQLEQSLEGSVKVSGKSIPTNRFGENEATVLLFKESAQKYGEFLDKVCKIKEMPVYLPNVQEKPFARQLWFGYLDDYSELGGYDRDLDYDGNGAFGVSVTSAESAKSAKNLDISAGQAEKYTKIIQGVRKGDLPASQLEEVLKYFSKTIVL